MAFGGKLDENEQEVMSEINMTPLVDVMLVLLIIFILTVPVLTHTVRVDLPQASNQPNKIKPLTVSLSITKEGEVYWDKVLVDDQTLHSYFIKAVQQQPQPDIQLHGDSKVHYEHVVKVMALAQQVGISNLSFITTPEGG